METLTETNLILFFFKQNKLCCTNQNEDVDDDYDHGVAVYHPKNKSIALLTMPELLVGVIGVPVISFAL